MQTLKDKILHTTLFDDADKVAILTAVDTYSTEDTKQLEAIIDEFDTKYHSAVFEYKKSVYGVLDDIVKKANPQDKQRFSDASSTIRSGVDMILQ